MLYSLRSSSGVGGYEVNLFQDIFENIVMDLETIMQEIESVLRENEPRYAPARTPIMVLPTTITVTPRL